MEFNNDTQANQNILFIVNLWSQKFKAIGLKNETPI